ncbi:nuclear transport factor 2 family protein [Kitasatospora sp. NBC_01302]|uniref:nuclear transport factor 2 family protein n=1 Tax=Kitasatospora sp. NBC_01302 TaxID=2903575 RepID=UPI002E0DEA80|nr:nuclear transport factor 2 family protein [Kitasatospora sp. NBC_01302]
MFDIDADPAQLRQGIEQFYAWQMQLLDDGKVEPYAQTFAEDGSFAANAHPAPFTGREAIAAAAGKATRALAEQGVIRRHWFGMTSVETTGHSNVVRTRNYAVVFETPRGGAAKLLMSTVFEDVLVRDEDATHGWLVRERRVSRDDLAA